MKAKIILMAVASLFLAGCATNAQSWNPTRIKESKNYVTKEIKVDNFTKISVNGSPTVHFTQKAGKPQVKVYTSDNIAEVLDIYEKGGTLYVGFKQGYSVTYNKLDINVSAPTLEGVNIAGSGEIYLDNGLETGQLAATIAGSGDIAGRDIRCGQLTAKISGSGDLDLTNITCSEANASVTGSGDLKLGNLQASTVEASVTGSGDLTVTGKAGEASYKVTGSGDLHASDLVTNRVKASVTGSGEIRCHATDYLKANTTGSGSIGYKGRPKELDLPRKNIYEL